MSAQRPAYGEGAYGAGYYGGSPDAYEALIESASGSTTARLVLDYSADRAARSQVHDTVDHGSVVVLAPARLRAGSLELLYLELSAAQQGMAFLSEPDVFELTVIELPQLNMSFVVVDGGVRLTPDPTRRAWRVRVDFNEVTT